MIANKSESNAYKDSANVIVNDDNDDLTEEGSQFHTWEVGEDSTFIQNSQVVEEVATIGTLQKSRSTYIHSDSEDEDEEDVNEDPSVPSSSRPESSSVKKEENLENPMSPARVPSKVLELRPLVSEEVIAEKEANIRNLFFKCKDILMAATVFTMAAKYEEKVRNGDDIVEDNPTEGINDEECLRENPSKIGIRRSTPKTAPTDENNRNKTNTERLLEKYNEEKNSGATEAQSEAKEPYSLKQDLLEKASTKDEPVRISIPKAGSSSDLNVATAAAAAARPKAEYKPLVHSTLKTSASPSVTTSSSAVINTTTIDTSSIPQPPAFAGGVNASLSARASSPAAAAAMAGSSSGAGLIPDNMSEGEPSPAAHAASSASSIKAKPRKKQTSTSSSTTSITGGIAAQFSADIAKLAAPLGSGLTRHGTKIKTSSSAKLRGEVSGASGSSSSSNTATFVVGDNVQNLMSQSSSGVLMQTNTNSIKPRHEVSDEAIVNVRITKKEHKQAFAVPSLSEAIIATAAEAKSSPVRGAADRKDTKYDSSTARSENKSESTSPTTKDAVPPSSGAATAAASNKGFGRFKNNSSMVVDTRGSSGGDVRSSGEYHHGIQPYTPTSAVPSVFQRSFSEPTNMLAEPPSPLSAVRYVRSSQYLCQIIYVLLCSMLVVAVRPGHLLVDLKEWLCRPSVLLNRCLLLRQLLLVWLLVQPTGQSRVSLCCGCVVILLLEGSRFLSRLARLSIRPPPLPPPQ